MDPLPDLNFAGHSEPLTISEQALLDKSKRDFKDQLGEALSQLKHSISTIASTPTKTVDPTLKASIETLGKLLGQHLSASLSTNRTKRELDSLQDVINSAEKLAFLVRYFNWENDENYVKFLSAQAPKVHSIIYAFNVFVQNLIKNIIQHIEVDPQVLLRFLKHLQEQETSAVPLELIGLRTPIKRKRTANELSRVILLDYYYLERSYRSLQDLLINGAASQTQKKIRSALQPEGGAAPASDIFGEDELAKKSSENKVLLELQKELERINQLKGEDEILNYLFKSKNRIDQTISQAETSIQTLEKEALTHVTEVLSRGELDDDSPKKTYTPLVLEKVDEIISAEVKGYSIGGKTLKQYWQEISERIRQEVAAMISMEKFLLQASYLSIYFEEKFVVFHAGRGQFMQENFAKLIEDFSNTANKEYKYMPQLNNSQGLHPLYYCYVAENFQDFYLVEYNPTNPVLKVYLTAAPMLATLHKHLAKLDITKISKKSFSITRLNFFDTDVGVELRNLFLDPKNRKQSEDSDDEEDEEVPKHFRYFVFITIFLLHNSPIQTNAPEIVFGVQDLINFYNYLAEFQSVTLKHQEDNQPIPTTFEFYYPFVNMRQTRDQYLIFNKKDPSRDIGLTSVRNICYQNKDFLQYGELLSEEKFYNESFFNNEVLKYLKRNETKPSFNFDGHPYLIEYLKRIPQTTPGQASDNAMTVFSRVQTQGMIDVFLAGDRNIDTVRGLEDSSKSAKVYLMFSGAPESLGLLMIAYDRVKNKCTVYLWDSKDTQDQEVLHEFVDYIKGSVRGDKGGLKTEGTTKYVVCRSRDEVVINYFRNHHFPYTYFFEQEALGVKGSLEIDLEDLVEPFKSFLSINISENNLDVFKVYSRILEDKMFKHWEIVNIGVMWKFSELKYTLQTLAEKLMEEQVDHVLLSFTYIGALGSKVYYLYLQEMVPEESKEETKMDTQSQEVTYLIDVYSLAYNLDLDDREILTIIYYCCKIISKPRLVFNAAYRINPRNNILLYTQVEITLTTLGYLVHFCNLSMERAFQKISRSIVSHYEILESLMSQTDALNQTEGVEQPGNNESNDVKESAVVEPNLILEGAGGDKQKANLKIYQSFFEDILKEVQFKKKLELEVPGLLKEVDFEVEEESESMDIASFLNILNCEIISPLTYFFATNEMFTKRVITNENNILTDKSVYSFLIKELASAKVKYEEALEIKYQSTTVYFICPLNLLHVHKIPLVKYNVESHQITYYYLKSAHEPKLNDNIAAFIDTLSLKLASTSNNPQTIKALSTRELKITPCPVVISEDLQDIVERQYPAIIKALIRFSSRQDLAKEHSLVLNTERFNTFMCEYAEDLLQSVETSKIKSNYRYLSNMFLQKESPITKKIALLTFLNGTASIEQLTIIKDCIKTFRDDFNKIEGIEHAFFCFNVSVKNSLKHYLLHLSGHSGNPVKLKVFTNVLGDTDSVIDRMIQAYCLEDGESSELSIFKINIPNAIFTRYLEISSFLIAHAVCNDVEDSNEYCAQLALSPIHYLNELKKFETKCEILNLFKEPNSPGRV